MEKKTFRQRVSKVVRGIYTNYLKYVKKVDIGKGVSISQRIDMDKVNPRGIHIGDETRVSAPDCSHLAASISTQYCG